MATRPPEHPARAAPGLLAQVVDAAPVGHLVTDADGVVLEANAAVLRWLGRGHDAVAGTRFAELLPAGQRVLWRTLHLGELERTGHLRGVVLDIVGSDTTVPVLLSASLMPMAQGRPLVGITLVEAAERRRYERDLLIARRSAERAEQRLRLLQRITELCARAADATALLASVSAALAEGLAASGSTGWLAEPSGDLLLAVRHDLADAKPATELSGAVPAATLDCLVRGEVVVAADADQLEERFGTALTGARGGSGVLLPFVHDGVLLGVVAVLLPRPWEGGDSDVRDLTNAASLTGQTLERTRLQETLQRLASSDALTGLPNRRAFSERLEEALARSVRSRAPVTVVFLDLDGFKALNDTLGHAAGDVALVTAAARLRSVVRDVDVVARLGGDEFVALCEGGDATVAGVVERIAAALEEPFDVDGRPVTLGASIGTAVHRPGEAPLTAGQLLASADQAMYVAKAARRNGGG